MFFLLIPSLLYSQTFSEEWNSLTRIPDAKLVSVHGDQIKLSEATQEAIVLFLLPKPESMSEGKDLMSDIRRWMDQIRARFNENVFTLLIVEPLKTSFPFFNIQKGKLKREPFLIVIDKHGEILHEFKLPDSELHMLIVDKELKISNSYPGRYSAGKEQEVFNQLESLLTGDFEGEG